MASGTSFAGGQYDAKFLNLGTLGAATVTLSGNVNPASIQFASDSTNYTLSGAGVIAGTVLSGTTATTSLSKSGASTLTVSMSNNTFGGGASVTAGTLILDGTSSVSAGTVAAGPLGTGTLTLSPTAAGLTLGAGAAAGAFFNRLVIGGGGSITFANAGGTLVFGGTTSNNVTLNVSPTFTVADGTLVTFKNNLLNQMSGVFNLSLNRCDEFFPGCFFCLLHM